MTKANTKKAIEQLRELYEFSGVPHPTYEVQDRVMAVLRALDADGLPEESIIDPVLESHLTEAQIEAVRDQKRSGTFAGPETNP